MRGNIALVFMPVLVVLIGVLTLCSLPLLTLSPVFFLFLFGLYLDDLLPWTLATIAETPTQQNKTFETAFPQDLPHQGDLGQEDEAEQADPSLDPSAHGQ